MARWALYRRTGQDPDIVVPDTRLPDYVQPAQVDFDGTLIPEFILRGAVIPAGTVAGAAIWTPTDEIFEGDEAGLAARLAVLQADHDVDIHAVPVGDPAEGAVSADHYAAAVAALDQSV